MPESTPIFNIWGGEAGRQAEKLIEKLMKDVESQKTALGDHIADNVRRLWISTILGSGAPGGWSDKYSKAIKVDRAGENPVVYADENEIDESTKKPFGMYIKNIEEGVKPWSIRDALLKSKKARKSSDGHTFIRVPFRWNTPKAKGSGKADVAFSGEMTRSVYNIVKTGARLSGDFGYMSGMQKFNSAGHSEYLTFRTVSDKTPTDKWQYQEQSPKPVFEKVLKQIGPMIEKTLEDFCMATIEKVKQMEAGK